MFAWNINEAAEVRGEAEAFYAICVFSKQKGIFADFKQSLISTRVCWMC